MQILEYWKNITTEGHHSSVPLASTVSTLDAAQALPRARAPARRASQSTCSDHEKLQTSGAAAAGKQCPESSRHHPEHRASLKSSGS